MVATSGLRGSGVGTEGDSADAAALADEEAWRAVVAWKREGVAAQRREREEQASFRAAAAHREGLRQRAEEARHKALIARYALEVTLGPAHTRAAASMQAELADVVRKQSTDYQAWIAQRPEERQRRGEEVVREKAEDYKARVMYP